MCCAVAGTSTFSAIQLVLDIGSITCPAFAEITFNQCPLPGADTATCRFTDDTGRFSAVFVPSDSAVSFSQQPFLVQFQLGSVPEGSLIRVQCDAGFVVNSLGQNWAGTSATWWFLTTGTAALTLDGTTPKNRAENVAHSNVNLRLDTSQNAWAGNNFLLTVFDRVMCWHCAGTAVFSHLCRSDIASGSP